MIDGRQLPLFMAVTATTFLLVASMACGRTEIPTKYKWFYELGHSVRAEAIVRLDPGTQVDLYLLSPYVEHPADGSILEAVAGEGIRVIPAVRDRLSSGKFADPWLFNLLHRMNELGHYAVADDPELMSQLEMEAERLPVEYWRQRASEQIEEIRLKASVRSPTGQE
jgi:hypothetical protein